MVLPTTLQFFIVLFACSLNERMQKALDYKTEEVLVLKQILRQVSGKDRIDCSRSSRHCRGVSTRAAAFSGSRSGRGRKVPGG